MARILVFIKARSLRSLTSKNPMSKTNAAPLFTFTRSLLGAPMIALVPLTATVDPNMSCRWGMFGYKKHCSMYEPVKYWSLFLVNTCAFPLTGFLIGFVYSKSHFEYVPVRSVELQPKMGTLLIGSLYLEWSLKVMVHCDFDLVRISTDDNDPKQNFTHTHTHTYTHHTHLVTPHVVR